MEANAIRLPAIAARARRIRRDAVELTSRARTSHVGSSLSMADVLAVLYSGVLRVNPAQPDWPNRDRFVLSKGHAAAGAYAALAEAGFFSREWLLENFCRDGSHLAGHITHEGVPGVDVSTGSLGHGLSLACGMALAGIREARAYRVFALLSDGECDEGSSWEGVLFASHHKLDNLIAIVDYNKIQSLGRVEEVLRLDPLGAKWSAFGWSVKEIDGHNLEQVLEALTSVPFEKGKPSCVVAHTVKGKGVSFMENQLLWHYKPPTPEELQECLRELAAEE